MEKDKLVPRPKDNHPPSPLRKFSTAWNVLRLLAEGKGNKKIAERLRLSTSTVKEHLRNLKEGKLAVLANSGYQITKRGRDLLGGRESLVGYERGDVITKEWIKDRAHNIKVKCEVVRKPTAEWLQDWKPDNNLKNQVFYKKKRGDTLITFTGKSVIFQLPVIYADDAELADAEAGTRAIALMRELEKEYLGLQLGNYKTYAQLISQHHAIPQEPISKVAKEHGLSYMDEKLHVDASETPELEFVDAKSAHADFARYVAFVKDFSTKETPKITELTMALSVMQNQLAKNQEQLGVMVASQTTTQKQILKLLPSEPKVLKQNKNTRIDYCG